MRNIVAIAAIVLSGCASNPYVEPLVWTSLGDGCYERGLSEVLYEPSHFNNIIGVTDIRIGFMPDTGQGPGFMAHFRQNNIPYSKRTKMPEILLAVGNGKRSCTVLLTQEDCPVAITIYEELAKMNIPISFSFDKPTGITLMHGTDYFLSFKDGQSNQTDWRFYGINHPIQEAIDQALVKLETCAKPAYDAFHNASR
jgi:hypothetical protein